MVALDAGECFYWLAWEEKLYFMSVRLENGIVSQLASRVLSVLW